MSSHLVLGLPRFLAPLIPPSITSFSIPRSYLITRPKYIQTPCATIDSRDVFEYGTHTLVFLSIHVKIRFYIVQYPVRWTAQSALRFTRWHQLDLTGKHSATLHSARRLYSFTFRLLSIARYSWRERSFETATKRIRTRALSIDSLAFYRSTDYAHENEENYMKLKPKCMQYPAIHTNYGF